MNHAVLLGEDEGVLHRHGVQPLGPDAEQPRGWVGSQLDLELEPHVRQQRGAGHLHPVQVRWVDSRIFTILVVDFLR